MSSQDIKEATLEFTEEYYNKTHKVPSVKTLTKKIKGLSTRQFYNIFPNGISEITDVLGIPEPEERKQQMERIRGEKGKPRQFEAKIKDETLDSLMRLLGAKTPQEAIDKAVTMVKNITSYSEIYGFKEPSEAWTFLENQIEELTNRNIELTIKLDSYSWDSEDELAERLGIPDRIMWQYKNYKRGRNIEGDHLIDYICGNFLEMQKLLRNQ